MQSTGWKLLKVGAWAPLLAFVTHMFLSRVLHAYQIWPATDIPMHFIGGASIAFFISRCFQALPRERVSRSRVAILELLLIGSLTATAAVFWEFAEFATDQLLGQNVQISLANTMQDLAMGILGGIVLMFIRSRRLRVGARELRDLTFEWVRGA